MKLDQNRLSRIMWGAAMLFLPVTSFRWFPFLGEGTLVRPLALYPLAVLTPLLLVQWMRGKLKLNWASAFIPLGAFIFFAIIAAAFGALLDPIPLRGQVYSGRALRALVTLFLGVVFFINAVWMNKTEDDLKFTIKWILAGLFFELAWCGLQAVTFYTGLLEKEMVTHWQLAFSMRELVRSNRISGLSYEPAWLAGQLATVYLPFLFAGIMTNVRIFRQKWLEPVLLVLSLLTLLATYSRGGLLTMAAAAFLTFLFAGQELIKSIWNWFFGGFRNGTFNILFRLGIIAGAFGVLTGATVFLAQKEYISNLWNTDADSLSDYMVDIKAGSRSAYSASAYAAFEEHPITGVGLGASGFYMYSNMPDWALTTVPEIAKQLSPESRLYPNPKNLYVRLLTETGLIGFFLFVAFQLFLLGEILAVMRQNELFFRYTGIAGLFAWFAITFYNFTQDSFTTPNIWLAPALVTGLSAILSAKEKE